MILNDEEENDVIGIGFSMLVFQICYGNDIAKTKIQFRLMTYWYCIYLACCAIPTRLIWGRFSESTLPCHSCTNTLGSAIFNDYFIVWCSHKKSDSWHNMAPWFLRYSRLRFRKTDIRHFIEQNLKTKRLQRYETGI